ncbi:MAG: hypothetical protein ABIW38_10450 [Ferruginibacter sp.]
MIKSGFVLFCFIFIFTCSNAQQVLPAISVNNLNGKIIVSWRNQYSLPVSNISIQRSYDSAKNYTTIGTVLNPQNIENGYADIDPPFTRMWYRVFISFEGGAYILSPAERPIKNLRFEPVGNDSSSINPLQDSSLQIPPPPAIKDKNEITYPSSKIFTTKDNNVVINLPDALYKKYQVKFYDELENLVFELNNLKDDFLILDKVNFIKAGWYRFEIFESGLLVEKNRFYVAREIKGPAVELPRKLNNR